jgi:hypothetical protein
MENIDEFNRVLERPQWSEWALEVTAKPREYKGVAKMRLNVRSARQRDWAVDCARLANALTSGIA